jgi:hypothetical protein
VWFMSPYYNCAAHMMLGPHEAASDFKRECKCLSSLLPQPPRSPGLSVHTDAEGPSVTRGEGIASGKGATSLVAKSAHAFGLR